MMRGGERLIRFNLIDEPFIPVLGKDGAMHEVGLKEILIHAQNYADIGGEMATQDVAILRLLLAIVHTVFSRVDENGDEAPFEETENAEDRWQNIWEKGCFPEKPLLQYLEKWHERFWLFHPEYPFYQVPKVNGLTAENALEKTGLADNSDKGPKTNATFTAAKLNGEIGESGHKLRLFSPRTGSMKGRLTYAEAARWLLALQAFDDASGKESKESKAANTKTADESIGVGWLGKLSLVHAVGRNLFETLMLNCVFLRDGHTLFKEDRPVWEKPAVETRERHYIAIPDNFAELLTVQSRRVLLVADQETVLGFTSCGGDYFTREGAINEQFTLWTFKKVPKGKVSLPIPQFQELPVQMWREFSSLLIQSRTDTDADKSAKIPGVVSWVEHLSNSLPLGMISFRYTKIKYDSKNCSVVDCLSDNLSLSSDLLSELGYNYIQRISAEIKNCEKAAQAVRHLGENLFDAEGGDRGGKQYKANVMERLDAGSRAAERYYYALDIPFRGWLMNLSIKDNHEAFEKKILQFRDMALKEALRLGKSMYEAASPAAFAGHWSGKGSGKEAGKYRHYSSTEAYLIFKNVVYSILGKYGKGGQK